MVTGGVIDHALDLLAGELLRVEVMRRERGDLLSLSSGRRRLYAIGDRSAEIAR